MKNLYAGTLIKRYRRFFVDVETEQGVETFHCPNTGSMSSLLQSGQKCWFSRSNDPKRKLKGTLEILETPDQGLALVNTQIPNKVVGEWLSLQSEYIFGSSTEFIKAEYPKLNSRFDFGGMFKDGSEFVLEVKNVTLKLDNGMLAFPDAITTRGQKHLEELMLCKKSGLSAHLVFLLSRTDGLGFAKQNPFDPKYQELLEAALGTGVKVHLATLQFDWNEEGLELSIQKAELL